MTIKIDPTKPTEFVLDDGEHVITLTIAVAHKAAQPAFGLPELTQQAAELSAGIAPYLDGLRKSERFAELRKIGTHCMLVARLEGEVAPDIFRTALGITPEPSAITGGYAQRFAEKPANAKAWCIGVLWQVQTALVAAGQPGLL